MKWHTEVRKISELKSWEDNPRTITDEEYNKLKGSIDELGNFDPLVIDTDGTVLAGNQRLRIYLERGIKEVEVSVPERKLTDKEIKKIGVLSNKHSGEWDMDRLAEGFEDILGEMGAEDLILEDINFDDIEGTENREKKFREMDVTCPHCGETFKIEV